MTEADILRMLLRECRRAGTQAEWAKAQGLSATYVSDVLKGRRAPGDSILSALGFERVVTYRRKSNTSPPSC